MPFDPILADIRFGCGLSPLYDPAGSPSQIINRLLGPDHMAARFPISTFNQFRPRLREKQRLFRLRRRSQDTATHLDVKQQLKLLNKAARKDQIKWMGQAMLRRTHTNDGFRERLTFFWADHFTALGKAGLIRRATSPYVEQAIRPHVTGRFADMLIACVTQPLMLHYLDQQFSTGPGSHKALRTQGKVGLNENLARELLELHTLGVDGPYDQDDVRQLAELLTGLTYNAKDGFRFRKDMAEPGAETVLGLSYGNNGRAWLSDVTAALEDLAVHPSTADHIAQKLAMHFISDAPDPALVADLAQAFRKTDGDLSAVYQVMLDHPQSWTPEGGNVKQPVDFIGSSLRALAIQPKALPLNNERQMRDWFLTPMLLMGQQWERPGGPDGWPEGDSEWITPQRMAARVHWAMTMPQILQPDFPDPRIFVETALGGRAPEPVRFAARAAEDRTTGIGLILSSPAFQRM